MLQTPQISIPDAIRQIAGLTSRLERTFAGDYKSKTSPPLLLITPNTQFGDYEIVYEVKGKDQNALSALSDILTEGYRTRAIGGCSTHKDFKRKTGTDHDEIGWVYHEYDIIEDFTSCSVMVREDDLPAFESFLTPKIMTQAKVEIGKAFLAAVQPGDVTKVLKLPATLDARGPVDLLSEVRIAQELGQGSVSNPALQHYLDHHFKDVDPWNYLNAEEKSYFDKQIMQNFIEHRKLQTTMMQLAMVPVAA